MHQRDKKYKKKQKTNKNPQKSSPTFFSLFEKTRTREEKDDHNFCFLLTLTDFKGDIWGLESTENQNV